MKMGSPSHFSATVNAEVWDRNLVGVREICNRAHVRNDCSSVGLVQEALHSENSALAELKERGTKVSRWDQAVTAVEENRAAFRPNTFHQPVFFPLHDKPLH